MCVDGEKWRDVGEEGAFDRVTAWLMAYPVTTSCYIFTPYAFIYRLTLNIQVHSVRGGVHVRALSAWMLGNDGKCVK